MEGEAVHHLFESRETIDHLRSRGGCAERDDFLVLFHDVEYDEERLAVLVGKGGVAGVIYMIRARTRFFRLDISRVF